jgi:hypothetical protein
VPPSLGDKSSRYIDPTAGRSAHGIKLSVAHQPPRHNLARSNEVRNERTTPARKHYPGARYESGRGDILLY